MIIYIEPKSSFQFLSSDTLYGAICSAICTLYKDFDQILEQLKTSPPFLISSAFPFVGEKNVDHFFPKPIEMLRKLDNVKNEEWMKKIKKAKYIHESIFNKWINGEINEGDIIENDNVYKIEAGLIYPGKSELKFKIKSIDIPKNSLNRLSLLSDIFYSSGNSFENAGLFFIIRFTKKEYEKNYSDIIQSAMKFLSDRGFGGDISSGKGHFEIKCIDDSEIILPPEKGERFISLSCYHPTSDEIKAYMEKENLWYDILIRRSRGADGRTRKQVRYFSEGSTFPDMGKEIYGRTIPIGEDAIGFGYAFNVKMRG